MDQVLDTTNSSMCNQSNDLIDFEDQLDDDGIEIAPKTQPFSEGYHPAKPMTMIDENYSMKVPSHRSGVSNIDLLQELMGPEADDIETDDIETDEANLEESLSTTRLDTPAGRLDHNRPLISIPSWLNRPMDKQKAKKALDDQIRAVGAETWPVQRKASHSKAADKKNPLRWADNLDALPWMAGPKKNPSRLRR